MQSILLYRGDMTGEYSYFTNFEEHEIMYHVSTLLPFSSDDRQQVLYLP
jgi:signal-induced proliferation-associated 1 like protein 2